MQSNRSAASGIHPALLCFSESFFYTLSILLHEAQGNSRWKTFYSYALRFGHEHWTSSKNAWGVVIACGHVVEVCIQKEPRDDSDVTRILRFLQDSAREKVGWTC